jgi:hypothetical protein
MAPPTARQFVTIEQLAQDMQPPAPKPPAPTNIEDLLGRGTP